MTEDMTGTAAGGCPRWAKLLLIGSLALNVAVIGLYAGHAMQQKDRSAGSRQIEWILKLVPDHKRDETKAHFGDIRAKLRRAGVERLENLDAIVGAIRAEPYDPTALQGLLDARLDGTVTRRGLIHERLMSLLTSFTDEERGIFADRLEAQVTKLRERRKG